MARKPDLLKDIKISNLYLDGCAIKDIRSECHCSDKLIYSALARTGTPVGRGINNDPKKLNQTEIDFIKKKYQEGYSSIDISIQMGRSKYAVLKTLKQEGINRRNRQENRTHSLDENAFFNVNNESAYWAGFLLADGNMHKSKQSSWLIQVALKKSDQKHLEKLRCFLKSSHSIINDRGNCRFSFSSYKIWTDLLKFGLRERKSGLEKAGDCIKSNPHFWRGVVDGDGSIYENKHGKWKLSLVGSSALLKQFSQFVFNAGLPLCSVQKHKSIWQVTYAQSSAYKVGLLLYDGSVALDRKQSKFNEMREFYE